MDQLIFRTDGRLLPVDEPYRLTLDEIGEQFGRQNHARRNLYDGLYAGVSNLFSAGVRRVIIGGSFISRKSTPNDVDGCWYVDNEIDFERLDPVFLGSKRMAKAKFCMDFKMEPYANYLQTDGHECFLRHNGRVDDPVLQRVGIVLVVPPEIF